ncbi:AarF/UbiB family protein [Coxiella-like endosymbiont]|uniref:AarF/UbiB family protein n=1 Tax=Coxiella-like endosymbiont TaxID=1592897 RepID=UPI001F4E52CB|nr:AarF/UbiB family protein [Coxiella-like endosymbiont]
MVKVLRPNIARTTIRHDITLMYFGAKITHILWKHGEQLKPIEIFTEFEKTIYYELDLTHKAAVEVSAPENPQYISVDFGIMGFLTHQDKRYIT